MKSFLCSFSSSRWFKKGCCQLQAKVCAQSTGIPLQVRLAKEKVWLGLDMTIAVYWDIKNQNIKNTHNCIYAYTKSQLAYYTIPEHSLLFLYFVSKKKGIPVPINQSILYIKDLKRALMYHWIYETSWGKVSAWHLKIQLGCKEWHVTLKRLSSLVPFHTGLVLEQV